MCDLKRIALSAFTQPFVISFFHGTENLGQWDAALFHENEWLPKGQKAQKSSIKAAHNNCVIYSKLSHIILFLEI